MNFFNDVSPTSLFTAYASLSASMMLLQNAVYTIFPKQVRDYLSSKLINYFGRLKAETTLTVEEFWGAGTNEIYDAARLYLPTKIGPRNLKFKVGKLRSRETTDTELQEGEEVFDKFDNIIVKWRFCHEEPNNKNASDDYDIIGGEENKVIRLYIYDLIWKHMDLQHPATFDTLAIEPELKQAILDDLDRFISRKDFYRKIGKAWKRGQALLCIPNKSILVVEDIDSNKIVHNRSQQSDSDDDSDRYSYSPMKPEEFTLSGLLNSLDGLGSSCGDERIIIFTTNHKEKLDPALLRPGRMDMHINMSYCGSKSFRVLASNYLDLHAHHPLLEQIDGLLETTEVTPASLAEELLKNNDPDVALGEVVNFLKQKKMETEKKTKPRRSKRRKTN
ncbi:ATPase, AAA-type, core [Corchorus capsularis]|uniref:ATPase, AAA-type, core n=1 Tax=Corchorus capsularis TaxID=210143 RepID=A0A1R3GFX1_COCAP|nr:ATPase, AAA-type, core [Corchorus capsularis]